MGQEYGIPDRVYGIPDQVYGIPDQEYGIPDLDSSMVYLTYIFIDGN